MLTGKYRTKVNELQSAIADYKGALMEAQIMSDNPLRWEDVEACRERVLARLDELADMENVDYKRALDREQAKVKKA